MGDQQQGVNQYSYGVRRIVTSDVHGQPIYHESALAWADFLSPTDDDFFVVGPRHDGDVAQLFNALQVHHRHNQLVLVGRELKIQWRSPILLQPRADIVIATSDEPKPIRGKRFSEAEWGEPPRCIIEVTAPLLADADLVDKVAIYAQGQVEEYIIVDSGLRNEQPQPNYQVIGYRLMDGQFHRLEADSTGQIISEVNRIKIGPTPAGDGIQLTDIRTNQPLASEELITQDRIAEVQGTRRADSIGSALDFLRGGE